MVVLYTVLACAAMFSIVPLVTWAATGSLSRACEALKGYMTVMGMLAALGCGFALLTLIPQAF
jgi:hypothetical protein